MSDVPHARRSAPSGGGSTRRWPGLLAMLVLACAEGSLDEARPSASLSSSSESGTLPVMDTGAPTTTTATTGEASSGDPPEDDDPRLCPQDCRVTLPIDWVYEGTPPAPDDGREPPPPPPDPDDPPPEPDPGFDPREHLVPTMIRDPADGSLVVGEQRKGIASIHRLDRHGQLRWNLPLPLPCDLCELTHIAPHPSGDLLLSASGLLFDRGYGLIAARYDPAAHTLGWATTTPLVDEVFFPVRSGEIAALSNDTIAQLYLTAESPFDSVHTIRLASYDAEGFVREDVELRQGLAMQRRHALLARPSATGDLVTAIPVGTDNNPSGLISHFSPPLWNTTDYLSNPMPLDDVHPDARGHTLELSHAFDGARTHLVLVDRADLEPEPRWVATLAFDSTTESRAALALSPDGEPYSAVRTTQALGEDAEPLVGLSLARWTQSGELRWHATLLARVDDTYHPVELVVDEDEGIILATVIDDRLRVERRIQRCECE